MTIEYDETNALQAACDQIGIEYKDVPADGKLHKVPVIGKDSRNTSGRIKLFTDGTGGILFNNVDGTTLTFWFNDTPPVKTAADKAARADRIAREKKEMEEAYKQCRDESLNLWDNVARDEIPAGHPYLVAKGNKPYGAKFQTSGGLLVIPVRDIDGTLHGLQFISGDGSKKFKTSTAKAGHFCKIPGDKLIIVCEGWATGCSIHEATGATVIVAFDAGNLAAVMTAIRTKTPNNSIVIAADNDVDTTGNPGVTKATTAATGNNAHIAVATFTNEQVESFRLSHGGKAPTDFNDLHQIASLDAVKLQIDAAILEDRPQPEATNGPNQPGAIAEQGQESDNDMVERLARLSTIEFDRVRVEAAKALNIRPGTLEKLVVKARKGDISGGIGFEDVEPWHVPVDPAILLDTIETTIKRFIICNPETAIAVSLWCAMTWLMDVVQIAPLAIITAPEKRCGKSQLLFLMGKLVKKPITASGISPAALFRSIEKWQPCLLIDEADAFMKDNEEIRLLLNSGHTRDAAYIIRTVGDNHEPAKFNTWGAKVVCGISAHKLADTLTDRAVLLELRRKLEHESVERLRYAGTDLFEELTAKLARFSDDYRETIRAARPNLPPSLNDRAQDNWEPLLAIADVAGGAWPDKARKAALKISGTDAPAMSTSTELLHDIKEVFELKQIERISTTNLILELCSDDERPWKTYNRGNPISPRQISTRLKEYCIHSRDVRIGLEKFKGYQLSQFQETFDRYLSVLPPLSATTRQMSIDAGLSVSDVSLVSDTNATRDIKETRKPSIDAGCRFVADSTPKTTSSPKDDLDEVWT